MMEFFVFLLMCAIAALALYAAKTRREVSSLREAVSALIGELRSRGMDDVVDGAKERAGSNALQSRGYAQAIRSSSRRRANDIDPPSGQDEPEDNAAQDIEEDYLTRPTRIAEPEMAKVTPDEKLSEVAPEPEVEPEPEPYNAPEPKAEPVPLSDRIEDLIGKKLPIWVGGISLIFGGFFLVRYSIEAGIFGPGVRVIMAAIFGLALVAASEAGRIWPVLDEDERLGQSLAGAGIAVLYGTLYMAGELYGLIGAIPAFIMLIIVTTGALLLSLKHGAPTAIMGLLGGFAAPYVAGLGPDSAGPLLIYLAIFTAGLFALSIHRGWMWLAMLASGGSVLWSTALMISGVGGASPVLGIFIVGLAIGGVMALEQIAKRASNENGKQGNALASLLRLSPIAIGLIQLAIFAPLIEFTTMGWLFYAALSIFAIIYAFRDPFMTPAPAGALALALVMLFSSVDPNGDNMGMVIAVSLGIAALFGGAGHWLAFRKPDGWLWGLIAIAAPAGVFAASFFQYYARIVSDNTWGGVALLAAAPIALLAWRALRHDTTASAQDGKSLSPLRGDMILILASLTTAILLLVPAIFWPTQNYVPPAILVVAITVSAWGGYARSNTIRHASLAFVILAILVWLAAQWDEYQYIESVAVADVPAFNLIIAFSLLPAALMGVLTWLNRDLLIGKVAHWTAFAPLLLAVLVIAPPDWHITALALLTLIAGFSVLRHYFPVRGQLALFALTILYLLSALVPFAMILGNSLVGETLHYGNLPTVMDSIRGLILPTAILAVMGWLHMRSGEKTSPFWPAALGLTLCVTGGAVIYLFAKQVLQIDTNAEFLTYGFLERGVLTQLLFIAGLFMLRPDLLGRDPVKPGHALFIPGLLLFGLGLARFIYFDALLLNPLSIDQRVGPTPVANLLTGHLAFTAIWLYLIAKAPVFEKASRWIQAGSLLVTLLAAFATVKQAMQGSLIVDSGIGTTENYLYSAVLILLAIIWLWRGIVTRSALLRVAGLLTLALAAAKVFLIDGSALDGMLRVVSYIGFGFAAIGIGWFYSRIMGKQAREKDQQAEAPSEKRNDPPPKA